MNFKIPNPVTELDFSVDRFYRAFFVASLFSIAAHFILVFYFYFLIENIPLSIYNVFSCSLFVFGTWLIRKGKLTIAFTLGFSEILFHCSWCTSELGWQSGFHYYILAVAPLLFLYNKWTKSQLIIFSTALLAVYFHLFYTFYGLEIPEKYADNIIRITGYINFASAIFACILILIYFSKSIGEMETELIKRNNDLEMRNEEKDLILKEIHHRVKNNLHVVNLLLETQSQDVKDIKVKQYLQDAQRRILSMATIHEKMYNAKNLKHILLNEYLESLIEDLRNIYASKKILFNVKTDQITLDMDTIVTLAFLINEILTNAVKHAFPNADDGEVTITAIERENGYIEMVIGDNGIGITQTDKENQSLGTELIQSFCSDLGGQISILDKPGTNYRITFNKNYMNSLHGSK